MMIVYLTDREKRYIEGLRKLDPEIRDMLMDIVEQKAKGLISSEEFENRLIRLREKA